MRKAQQIAASVLKQQEPAKRSDEYLATAFYIFLNAPHRRVVAHTGHTEIRGNRFTDHLLWHFKTILSL